MHFWNCKTCTISSSLWEKLWMVAVAEIGHEYQFPLTEIKRWLLLRAGEVFQPGISEIQPAWWYFHWAVQYGAASAGKQSVHRDSRELSASGGRLPGKDGEYAFFTGGSLATTLAFFRFIHLCRGNFETFLAFYLAINIQSSWSWNCYMV